MFAPCILMQQMDSQKQPCRQEQLSDVCIRVRTRPRSVDFLYDALSLANNNAPMQSSDYELQAF